MSFPRVPRSVSVKLGQMAQMCAVVECRHHSLADVTTALTADHPSSNRSHYETILLHLGSSEVHFLRSVVSYQLSPES